MKGPRDPIEVAGLMIDSPRCLHPVEFYTVARGRDELDVIWPRAAEGSVCWRPAGHPGSRHVAKASYLRELERRRRWGHPERRREAS